MRLIDKYRPKSFDEFVGQPKVLERVKRIMASAEFDRDAWILIGPTGCGKSSLARIVAKMVADPFEIQEVNGQSCNVEWVRKAKESMFWHPLIGNAKVWIVNECHAMSAGAVQEWLSILDDLPANRFVFFTTTEKPQADLFGKFVDPFLDRCKVIEFTNQGLAHPIAEMAKRIAMAEGCDGEPIEAYLKAVKRLGNSPRRVVQAIADGTLLDA